MSLNTAHANNGVLIYSGECILLYCDHVTVEFSGQDKAAFKGSKTGRLFLTTHRMIFNNKNLQDSLASFSFPFCTLKDVELEQPMFGANYLKGKVRAQPNGGWIGEAKFKLHFKHGGAIEFGQAMLQAAGMVNRNSPYPDAPPPYYPPPAGQYHQAPPPSYQASSSGYYGWAPPTHVFPDAPPANSVFMTDMPPPYPGLNNGAAPQYGSGGKAAEAAASATAYYDPNKPNYAYVPPPAYAEAPPSYDDSKSKKWN